MQIICYIGAHREMSPPVMGRRRHVGHAERHRRSAGLSAEHKLDTARDAKGWLRDDRTELCMTTSDARRLLFSVSVKCALWITVVAQGDEKRKKFRYGRVWTRHYIIRQVPATNKCLFFCRSHKTHFSCWVHILPDTHI